MGIINLIAQQKECSYAMPKTQKHEQKKWIIANKREENKGLYVDHMESRGFPTPQDVSCNQRERDI